MLLPLLALTLTFAMVASVHAQDHYAQGSDRTSASMTVSFGNSPHWTTIHGTHVKEISGDQRPDYDMFYYNNHYYAYNDNRWYMSKHGHGQFNYVDEHSVPTQLASVPRQHWHNYPSSWSDRHPDTHSNPYDQHH